MSNCFTIHWQGHEFTICEPLYYTKNKWDPPEPDPIIRVKGIDPATLVNVATLTRIRGEAKGLNNEIGAILVHATDAALKQVNASSKEATFSFVK